MRSRGLVVVLALALAVGATAAVIFYVNGVKKDAEQGGSLKEVVVAKQDVLANTNLNPLLDEVAFEIARVPESVLVADAVTSLDQLRNQTTTTAILANEQIPTSRLSGGTATEGGRLGITSGNVAVTVKEDGPRGGGGEVARGDSVTVYATFTGASVLRGTLPQLLRQTGTAISEKQDLPDFTLTLIPTVRVLAITNPPLDDNGNPGDGDVTLTLDLTPEDAQNLVFAQENATVWVGLLPPNEEGTQIPASTLPVELLIGKKQ